MLKTAVNRGINIVFWLIVSAVFFWSPKSIFAVQYQQCASNSSCTVGEFLYNDEYEPIAVGSTCTLTSRYPNGDLLVNGQTMTGTTDGWYSYNVGTSGLSNGIYRGQMCCTTNGENICLDKTFEVSTTLSSIVSDIWASPNRSLTSFGTLIGDIWNNPTRKLTSSALDNGTSLATSANLSDIGSTLANLSTQVSAVQTDITTINSKVDSLQTQVGTIATDTTNLLAKWGSYSQSDVINYIDTLETQLGNNTQTCSDNTVFGHIDCIQGKWGSETAATIYNAANGAYTTATSLRLEIGFNGKSTTAYDEAIALKAYVDTIENSIGSSSDTSSTASIFGRIQQTKEAVDAIDNSLLDLNYILAKWDDLSADDIYDKVKDLSSQISAINTVSSVTSILNNTNNNNTVNNTNTTNIIDIKNQVFAMKALLDVNRIQLEKIDNKPIIKTWLENGSIIFKTLITNPSATVRQEVPFTYYLPVEVKQANIIKKSDKLTIKYDTSKGVLYASGDFQLEPKETIIVEIEVEDIWSVSQEKIESLRRQANELFEPLKKTSYFAQGSSLRSDIQASLDRIVEIQKPTKLPEEKIKDYREAQIELDSVNKKMDSLKEIVTSAGSIGTLSGFIGGVQTLGVWGIIVVLVAGFVFLAIYIKPHNSKDKGKTKSPIVSEPTDYISKKSNIKSSLKIVLFLFIFGLSTVSTSVFFGYYIIDKTKQASASKPAVLSAKITITPTPKIAESESISKATLIPEIVEEEVFDPTIETVQNTPTPTLSPTKTPVSLTTLKKAVVVPSINNLVNVNVRSAPDKNSSIVSRVAFGTELTVISEKYNEANERWLNISSGEIDGWVFGDLVKYIQISPIVTPSAKIKINVPPRDVVYIYSKPSYNASITHKISESQTADILLETKMWAKIILSRLNIEGWVSRDFIQKNIP